MNFQANNSKQSQDKKETESQTRKSRFEPIQAVSSQVSAQVPRDPRLANRKPKEETQNTISSPEKTKQAQINDGNLKSHQTGIKRLSTSPNHTEASDVKKPRISSNSSNTNRQKSNENLRDINKPSESSSKTGTNLMKKQQNHTQQENKVPTSNSHNHTNTTSKQHQVDAKNSTSISNKSNSEHEQQLNKNKISKQHDINPNQSKQSSSQNQQKQSSKSSANNSSNREEMNHGENEKKRSNRNEANEEENMSSKSNQTSNTSKKIPSLLEVPIQPPKSLVLSPEKNSKSKVPNRFAKPSTNENANKSAKTDSKNSKQTAGNENRSVSPSSSSKPKKAKLSDTKVVQDENFQRDVDLRSFNQLDEFKNQISILNNLLVKTDSNTLALSPTQRVTDDVQTDSNKEENNDQLEKNRNSLNELQKRLIESKENDSLNSKTALSTTTLDLMGMIKTLIRQQESILTKQKAIIESENMINSTNDINLQQIDQQSVQQGPVDQQIEQEEDMNEKDQQSYINEFASQADLPPIKAKDKNENNNDSLLLIDARSYRIQPDSRCLIRIYYHDHELFCDTRTKDVYIDSKRVLKMGDQTKDIQLNGRKVRVLYMGKKIELWIDGISFHFRADSPPKQITLASSQQVKRYHVTIDSRTMDMYFNNYKVCNINGGPYGNGQNIIMCQLSPDDDEMHEISFICPPKRIMIDGLPRKMRYDLRIPCIEMDNGELYVIRFSGAPKEIYIDNQPYSVSFDQTLRIKLNGRVHELAWGGPGFEVIIDGRPYELQFNKPPREIIIGTRSHLIYIGGDAPDVKICGKVPYELLEEASTPQSHNQKTSQNRPAPLMSQQIQAPSDLTESKSPNVHELLSKLIKYNILPTSDSKTQTSTTSTTTNLASVLSNLGSSGEEKKTAESKIPDLTSFDSELLKQKYNSAIQSLYTGIQCATCGHRFNQNKSNNQSRYSKHLDWHFRQNKREKDEINKAHSRSWYYSFSDWILYEEISEDQTLSEHQTKDVLETNLDSNVTTSNQSSSSSKKNKTKKHLTSLLSDDYDEDEENDDNEAYELDNEEKSEYQDDKHPNDTTFNINNNIENILRDTSMAFNLDGVKTCAASDDVGDSCYICNDPFEIFFHQEKEEWHFKDAIRIENRLYHPICLEDNINNQSVVKDEPV
jgi:hypothetical protein